MKEYKLRNLKEILHRSVAMPCNDGIILVFWLHLNFALILCRKLVSESHWLKSDSIRKSHPRCHRRRIPPSLGLGNSPPERSLALTTRACLSLVRDWGILYFYVSFGYVLARTAAVLFLAADVHAESRRPRAALYAVPAGCWGVEAHRFLTQVLGDDVALTGLRFFAITRTLILTVAGTVATYEVVLLQLDGLSTKQKATQERSSNQSDVCP